MFWGVLAQKYARFQKLSLMAYEGYDVDIYGSRRKLLREKKFLMIPTVVVAH